MKADEQTICTDEKLSALDEELNENYRKALESRRGDDTTFREEQRSFLKRRRLCEHDSGCIRELYERRNSELREIVLGSRGENAKKPLYDIELVPYSPHGGNVHMLEFSRDGSKMLSASYADVVIKLWDVPSGRLIRTFQGHEAATQSIAFSPDGSLLASGCGDRTNPDTDIKIWDVATGRRVQTLSGHDEPVNAVAFSPDGRLLISGSSNRWSGANTLKLWSASSGRLLREFPETNSIGSIAISPSGRVVAVASTEALKLWHVDTGKLMRSLKRASGSVSALAFSRDGKRLVSGGDALEVRDVETGHLLRSVKSSVGSLVAVAFAPDDAAILAAGVDGLGVVKGDADAMLVFRTLSIQDAEFAAHNTMIVGVAETEAVENASRAGVQIYDLDRNAQVLELGRRRSITALALSHDDSFLISASSDGILSLWDLGSGLHRMVSPSARAEITDIAISGNDSEVAYATSTGDVGVWSMKPSVGLRTLLRGNGVAYLPGLETNAIATVTGGDREVVLTLLNTQAGVITRKLQPLEEGPLGPSPISFSPSGKFVVFGNLLFDLGSGRLLEQLNLPNGVASSSFSKNGERFVAAGADYQVAVYNTETWKRVVSVVHNQQGEEISKLRWVNAVVLTPDGQHFLTGGQDGRIRMWDATTGRFIRAFRGHSGSITSLAFFTKDRRFASSGDDNTIRIWNADTGSELVTLTESRSQFGFAITAEGFFNGGISVGHDSLSVIRGMEVIGVNQMFRSLHAPDLVRQKLAGDEDGEVQAASVALNLSKVMGSGLPPKIEVMSHIGDEDSATDVISLTVRLSERGGGIGQTEWRVNGVTSAVVDKPSDHGPEYTLTQQLALDPGDNTIEIVAYNGSNLLASVPARKTIKYTGPTDGLRPNLHVLAIGIDAYADRGWTPPGGTQPLAFGPLGLAVKDATTLAAALEKSGASLYAGVRITKALNAEATVANIEAIIDKMATEIHPRDTFVLFAAAHGTSLNGRFYMIPQDYQGGTDPKALASRAISQDRLQDWVANRIKAKKVFIMLDTCESGALVGGALRSRINVPASEAAVGRLHEATGRPVLTAAAEGQFAHEGVIGDSGIRHGVFTWAILDALKKGDRNGNGMIELSELVAHVQSEVPALAARLGGEGRAATATPVFGRQSARYGSRGEDFVLTARMR